MAIQNRRGAYVDLNPAKAVPGELLVVQSGDPNTTDGKAVYMTFASGDIKLLAMRSDVETAVADVAEDLLAELDNTISTFTETTAPGAVADVADEGAAQITAIGNKGDEVLGSIPSDYSTLSGDVSDLKSATSLHDDEIDNTVQTITFASDGSVQKIEHKRNNVIIRTDTFTFATNMITEVRTLNTGETLTIATNLTTLETTVTYAAA